MSPKTVGEVNNPRDGLILAQNRDTAAAIAIWVPGRPAPQGSKRHVGRGVLIESSKELGPWRERVALAAHNAMVRKGWPMFRPGTAVAVDLIFVMPRPASTPRSTPPAVKRPDIDKLGRAILDALTNVCFGDDSAVVTLTMHKRIARPEETPGVTITIREARP